MISVTRLQMIFNEARNSDDALAMALASIAMSTTQVNDYHGNLKNQINEALRTHGSASKWCALNRTI